MELGKLEGEMADKILRSVALMELPEFSPQVKNEGEENGQGSLASDKGQETDTLGDKSAAADTDTQ